MAEIKLKTQTTFFGRNGTFKCTGFYMYKEKGSNVINIYPVTSKNRIGRCSIAIPPGEVENFIDCLRLTEIENDILR